MWKGLQENVRLGVEHPVFVTIQQGRYAELQPSIEIPQTLEAPITQGQHIGTLKVFFKGKTLVDVPLVALDNVPEANFFKRLWDSSLLWWWQTKW